MRKQGTTAHYHNGVSFEGITVNLFKEPGRKRKKGQPRPTYHLEILVPGEEGMEQTCVEMNKTQFDLFAESVSALRYAVVD